jgi:hydrogenase maturation factor
MVPAALSAFCPWHALTTGFSAARDPNLIFTAFGDMMRIPGTHDSPREHKERGMERFISGGNCDCSIPD